MGKLQILILGGCGFIGRNLVAYLIDNDLAKTITLVDKVPPQIAWLNETHLKHTENPIVMFKSANLINPESCKTVFNLPDGSSWDLVVNCAGETRPGKTDAIYEEGILKLSINCAKQAALQNVGRFVELSSGNMFSSSKVPHDENGPLDPWTYVAKWKKEVEKRLGDIPNLRYTILRLPLVYGLGDKYNIMPRIIAASIYKELNKTMKLLWGADLKTNTIHVKDVCRAVMFVFNKEESVEQVYNVVDDADSTQGSISDLLADIFGVKVEYYGQTLSSCVDLDDAVDDANDKHMVPWAEACRRDGVENTPLSPHMDVTLLLNKNLYLDGSKLKKLGFGLDVPKPTAEKFKEIINDYVQMKLFPKSFLNLEIMMN